MSIGIKAIEYALPKATLSNDDLAKVYSDWSSEKIFAKTGIQSRHVVGDGEYASDLAVLAAEKLFASGVVNPEEIDFVILVTQSPDFLLPTTACVLQSKLGLSKKAGAFDINLGCSGYVYGLAVAKSLVNTNIASNVLLLTAEAYSKFIHPDDRSTRTIFGDAATATLICRGGHAIGEFDLGTDGSGKDALILPPGFAQKKDDKEQSLPYSSHLCMNGPEVFNFTIQVVPPSITNILQKHSWKIEEVDLFVFHQANKFMLDFLRKKIGIPEKNFFFDIADIGNTVSSTIPIALKRAESANRLHVGDKVVLTGFGVGLSWGSTALDW